MNVLRGLIVFLFCFFYRAYSQDFTPQQKAWLFRVVEKSPCLKNNIGQYFTYTGSFSLNSELPYFTNKEQVGYQVSLWDSIEHSIVCDQNVLLINWEGISTASPGVLAEAAVKLSLWEIYSNIKSGYQEFPKFSGNKMASGIYEKAISFLPSEMTTVSDLKPKYQPVLYQLINPSLNFKRKTEAFSCVKNINASQKKLFFEKWYKMIKGLVDENSNEYFERLANRKIYFSGNLLAVGEGSGSSGLLKEYEQVDDGYTGTGTGKGIGLFTYKVGVKKGNLQLESTTESSIPLLLDEPTLLHLSLWGLDWSKKPLVVIERGDRSYLLFGNLDFSPDKDWSKGTSYFDEQDEFKERKIDRLLLELNKDGGLLSIYQREANVRDKIQIQIDLLNAEIDSIKKTDNPNLNAIQQRFRKNEVNLSNLSVKKERLASLHKKISEEYQKIDIAEKELFKMKSVLGENIQNWTVKDSVFTFEDGTVFNAKTQDLILNNENDQEEKITVKLLAASYSIYSDKKDEVQLYVNVTGGVNSLHQKNPVIYKPDTLFVKSFYFNPDEYRVHHLFNEKDIALLLGIARELKRQDYNIKTSFVAMGIDSIFINAIVKEQADYVTKKNQPEYVNARRVDLMIVKRDNEYCFSVKGYADPGSTSLSKVLPDDKVDFDHYKTSEQSFNPALSLLRVKSVIEEIEKLVGINLSGYTIKVPVVGKEVFTETIVIK